MRALPCSSLHTSLQVLKFTSFFFHLSRQILLLYIENFAEEPPHNTYSHMRVLVCILYGRQL